MEKSTKILVVKARECIYTLIFLALLVLLGLILYFMFHSDKKEPADEACYTPGIYTASVELGEQSLNVEVTVDANTITHIGLVNTSETVATMYPLINSSIDDINSQLPYITDIEELTYSGDNRYTFLILKQAIAAALKKAGI